MKLLVCTTEYFPYGAGIANVVYNVVEQLKKMLSAITTNGRRWGGKPGRRSCGSIRGRELLPEHSMFTRESFQAQTEEG